MAKGGSSSGGGATTRPDPMAETRAQIALERERARLRASEEAANRARVAREEAAKKEKARTVQTSAFNDASRYDDRQLSLRGVDRELADRYGISDLYQASLEEQRRGLDPTNDRPTFATSTAFNDALTAGTDRYRTDTTRAFRSLYGDTFATDTFGDTADDSIINALLDDQEEGARATIEAARARGTLNDRGYQSALEALAQQRTRGSADASRIGSGVLTGYRDRLNTTRTNLLNSIGTSSLVNPFDNDSATRSLTALRDSLTGSLSGDLTSAFGGQQFFDTSAILGTAGSRQGNINPSDTVAAGSVDSPLLSSFIKRKQQRGTLGSSLDNGVF